MSRILGQVLGVLGVGLLAVAARCVDAAAAGPDTWTCTVRSASVSTTALVTASCLGNEKLVSGGCSEPPGGSVINWGVRGTTQSWSCQCTAGCGASTTAYANCCE